VAAGSRLASLVDRGVLRFMEARMSASAKRAVTIADPRAELAQLAAAYSAGTLGLPSPFFPTPPAIAPALTPRGDGPLATHVVDLAWRSDYAPFHPAAREPYLAVVENATAHARWWTSERGRPTIVLLHGWGGGNHWWGERTFEVAYWLRHGFDAVAFTLPFHGDRAPGISGAMFPGPNPLRTNEAFGQAIYDLRALAAWLIARGSSGVGAMGMSLGGYTTALWASLDPQLAFAVAMIPAVSMAALFWRHGEASPARKRAVSAGITEELLADAFAVHAPTTRPAAIDRARRFVIAGRGDRITPPDQAERLAAHWGVDVAWFDGGHLAQIGRRDVLRDVRRRLGELALPGRSFRE
jgi:pimeloyl-ACP methyl ester carboxylesterase